MAAALVNLIDAERSQGAFEADLDTPTLAYAIMRISEGFLYADVIADRPPDIRQALAVIDALLLGLDRSRQISNAPRPGAACEATAGGVPDLPQPPDRQAPGPS